MLPLTRDELEQYDMESFRYSQQKKGDDPSDTFGVKLYVPGDNVKAIHWKLSGKTDELMVKEFGLPVDSQILILADRDLTAEMTPRQRSELTETAIHLSYTLLGENLPHCVGWYDYGTADFVIQTVTTEDNFWEAARGLLAAPFQADQLSSVAHFIAAEQGKPYSTYLWVSYGETDIERLMQYGRVNAYKPELFP